MMILLWINVFLIYILCQIVIGTLFLADLHYIWQLIKKPEKSEHFMYQYMVIQKRIIDDSDVGTIGNSQQATLTIDELRVIINNWVQNLNSGGNNVI